MKKSVMLLFATIILVVMSSAPVWAQKDHFKTKEECVVAAESTPFYFWTLHSKKPVECNKTVGLPWPACVRMDLPDRLVGKDGTGWVRLGADREICSNENGDVLGLAGCKNKIYEIIALPEPAGTPGPQGLQGIPGQQGPKGDPGPPGQAGQNVEVAYYEPPPPQTRHCGLIGGLIWILFGTCEGPQVVVAPVVVSSGYYQETGVAYTGSYYQTGGGYGGNRHHRRGGGHGGRGTTVINNNTNNNSVVIGGTPPTVGGRPPGYGRTNPQVGGRGPGHGRTGPAYTGGRGPGQGSGGNRPPGSGRTGPNAF